MVRFGYDRGPPFHSLIENANADGCPQPQVLTKNAAIVSFPWEFLYTYCL
jgi:hypothetical protein